MNMAKVSVSSNAYYTPEYLQERYYRHKKELRISPEVTQEHVPRSEVFPNRTNERLHGVPKQPLMAHGLGSCSDQNVLNKQCDNISTSQAPGNSFSPSSHPFYPRRLRHSVDYNDYYGLMPRKNSSVSSKKKRLFFSKHVAPKDTSVLEEAPYQGDDTSLYEPSLPNPEALTGYYAQQHRKYEESEFSGSSSVHQEYNSSRKAQHHESPNPMDVVFDDPSKRDKNTKQKFARAFKLVVPKFARTGYATYDYSQDYERDEPVSLAVRSDYDDGEWDDPRSGPSSNTNVYEKHNQDHGFIGNESRFPQTSHQRQDSFDHELSFGSAPNFNPLWSYMLSWLIYTRNDGLESESSTRITEIPEEELASSLRLPEEVNISKSVHKGERSRKWKSKGILLKWNKPASAYFNDQEEYPDNKPMFGFSQSKDFRNVAENENGLMLYNTRSGQLQPFRTKSAGLKNTSLQVNVATLHEGTPRTIISNVNKLIKNIRIMRIIFAPIDLVAENFPRLQTFVIFTELFIFMWILYELSLLIDALCIAVKAVCAPMIAVGKFMNRIV